MSSKFLNIGMPKIFTVIVLPYFIGYKRELFFPSKTIPKNLDPSFKMDLDIWDGLGRVKRIL